MKTKVFVDGQAGTTGLEIHKHLSAQDDIALLEIEADKRKDTNERTRYLNEADIVFLCLPDDAAREAVGLITNPKTRVIDASTAHRTAPGWVYGIPELSKENREAIARAARVAVPGCFACGFVMLVYPLVARGLLPKDYPITCHALTGYSGRGSRWSEEFEASDGEELRSPCFYATELNHKHLPEMQKQAGLAYPPLFTPIIANFYRGMIVAVPVLTRLLEQKTAAADIALFYKDYYNEPTVKVHPVNAAGSLNETGFFPAISEFCEGKPNIEIFVSGGEARVLLTARLDNLGKGASAAAVQCMRLMMKGTECYDNNQM